MGNREVTWRILNPVAESELVTDTITNRLPDLNDKKIGLFSNGKPGVLVVMDSVEKLLKERFRNIEFVIFDLWPGVGDGDIYKRMAGCDAIIAAIGD